jgi:RNA polymerase sigma-70 factor, ECF subfamily
MRRLANQDVPIPDGVKYERFLPRSSICVKLSATSERQGALARNVPGGRGRMSRDMDVAMPRSARMREKKGHEGFETFYRDAWDRTYRTLAVTFRDAELAKEAVDEGMARALSNWRYLSADRNRSGWVYRVAFNWAVDQIRRKHREQKRTWADAGSLLWVPDTPRPDLTEKVNQLSLEQRAVVVLRVVNDWPERDVAYALGIPVGTVKSRLSRALEILRLEVENDD